MVYDTDDTIAAIGTAAGGSPRGMVRISGPKVLDCLEQCFVPADRSRQLKGIQQPSRIAGSLSLRGEPLVQFCCDLLVWPDVRSYTRQPTAELHTIGSPPLLEALLESLCDNGARLAEPGEFTLRAFLAGRIDLTQAEAVLGVIDAHSSTELDTALAQLAGGLSQPLSQIREQLLQLLAELEAGLDFVDEDIEFITADQLSRQLSDAQAVVAEASAQLSKRSQARDLPRVVLSGPPNAGKSSLFNALIKRFGMTDVESPALVSDQSGTTRDFVRSAIELNGVAWELIDTAGLEQISRSDSIHSKAQELSGKQQDNAAALLKCRDLSASTTQKQQPTSPSEIYVGTKCDLQLSAIASGDVDVVTSSKDGVGLDELARLINDRFTEGFKTQGNSLSLTTARCAASLSRASTALTEASQLVSQQGGDELIAAEVRDALHAIGQVVGAVYTDDILDRIFGQFCIGK